MKDDATVSDRRDKLRRVKTFPSLVAFLRDELDWPITTDDFEEATFDYSPEELGLNPAVAAKIKTIKRLRPLTANQPWGIFFVDFEPKRLPVVALRRILNAVVSKKRTSGSRAERVTWVMDDLMFVSTYGEGDSRQISFAHFSHADDATLPELKVLGWDNRDTSLHLDSVADTLSEKLAWPQEEENANAWRESWSSAFTLRHREVISTSRELSIRLAELARAIRDRILAALDVETEGGSLMRLMGAFRESLVHDLSKEAFADMYAQTIAYGLLSARIVDPDRTAIGGGIRLPVTNPFLRELMEEFLSPNSDVNGAGIDFDELGINEVIDLLDEANMEAVVKDFGDRNPDEDPVIHFYESFLSEYDSDVRMQRGVFYTPRPVVSYIVRSVDELLRSEFGLSDGLADTKTWREMAKWSTDLEIPEGVSPDLPFVQILDPATGTGTFLVEVIETIHQTLATKWKAANNSDAEVDELWNEYVPKHLLPRLHGYELLMAPYAIAHLKVGLKLHETGYRFDKSERVRLFLTNSLEPATESSDQLDLEFSALADEARAANRTKDDVPATVVIGNPPYSVKSWNQNEWIRDLIQDYKQDLNETKLNLDDDFIKFLRYASYRCERASLGVVGFITNNIYLSGVTHRRMREELLNMFNERIVVNLRGDSRYGEIAPSGMENDNVFDIQQGVAIAILSRTLSASRSTRYLDVWGTREQKMTWLLGNTQATANTTEIESPPPLHYLIPRHGGHSEEYFTWVDISELMPVRSNGIETHRDSLTVHFTQEELSRTVRSMMRGSDEEVRERLSIRKDGRDWKLNKARASLKSFDAPEKMDDLVLYRPFDVRHTIMNQHSGGFLAYPRWDVMKHLVEIPENLGLVTARIKARGGTWDSAFVARTPIEKKTGDSTRSSTLFPLYVVDGDAGSLMTEISPNLNLALMDGAGVLRLDDASAPQSMFHYVYAILHSPTYRITYGELLESGFPRVPPPPSSQMYRRLGGLGADLVALHLLEEDYWAASWNAAAKAAAVSPLSVHSIEINFDGGSTVEAGYPKYLDDQVFVNRESYFGGISPDVWKFTVGGYPVCHKWLKDRRGRLLTADDADLYRRIVVAINETIKIMEKIDDVIDAHGGWPEAFVAADGDGKLST